MPPSKSLPPLLRRLLVQLSRPPSAVFTPPLSLQLAEVELGCTVHSHPAPNATPSGLTLTHAVQEFLGEPNGPLAHELLHTHYTDRSRSSLPAYSTFERMDEEKQLRQRLHSGQEGRGQQRQVRA